MHLLLCSKHVLVELTFMQAQGRSQVQVLQTVRHTYIVAGQYMRTIQRYARVCLHDMCTGKHLRTDAELYFCETVDSFREI